jgi:hypothetical protein
VSVRQTWIEPAPAGQSSAPSLSRQCELAGVTRSGVYRCWKGDTPVSELDLKLLRLIDAEYTRRPFYGSRRMVLSLRDAGYQVNRKRVQRLMKVLGLAGMLPGPHTSKPHPTPSQPGGTDYREVDLDTIDLSRPRSVGAEHVSLEALRMLGLEKKLAELGFNAPQTAAAIGTIIGRACEPGSELATHRWLRDRSGLGELIGYDFATLKLHEMYRIADRLLARKAALEEHLFRREQSLFGLQETITLYDLTNTYFEGQSRGNALAAHGHSKEKRADCPLVTLGLVLDSSGFPRRSHVYKGNVNEPGTLADMISGLEKGSSSSGHKPTVVMDAGIATEDNLSWLTEHHYPYLVVSRKKHREFDEASSVVVKQDTECTVRVHQVFDENSGETLLYCHSTQREKKDTAISNRFVSRFEEALEKLRSGLHKKQCLKNYDKVMVKIGRMRQK